MNVQKAKGQALTVVAIIGLIVAAILFWKLATAVVWACYYAGIPM